MRIRLHLAFIPFILPFLLASCGYLSPRADGEADAVYVVPRDTIFLDSTPLSSAVWRQIQFSENRTGSVRFERTTGRVFLVKCNSSDETVAASETGYAVDGVTAAGSRAVRTDAGGGAARLLEARSGGIPRRADFPPAAEFYERLKRWNGGTMAGGARSCAAEDGAVQSSRSLRPSAADGGASYFWTIENSKDRQLQATRKAVGEHCEVWFADNAEAVAAEDISFQTVADKFDAIYELEADVFGSPHYASDEVYFKTQGRFILPDSGGRITILLLDIDADAEQQNSSVVMGYFYAADMFSPSAASSMGVKTNGRELIYIDSYCMKNCPDAAYATLAHEFQHLLNFVQKTIKNGGHSETWYNEMLSMVCEDMMTGVLKIRPEDGPVGRLSLFNSASNLGFTTWRSGDDVLHSYANSYAFGAYLARNFGGVGFIRRIAQNASANEDSIEEALSKAGFVGTFRSAAGQFAQCALFTAAPVEGGFMSLNRTASEGRLAFPAVNLEEFSVPISGGRYSGPFIYISQKEGGQVGLDPHGFSVHYVGTGLDSVTVRAPESDAVDCYLLYESE